MNGWDLKILYRDLESWKKCYGMEWFRGLRQLKKMKKIECNGMGEMSDPNKWLMN